VLAPNEPLKAQPGAMMMMGPGITVEAKADGGVMKGQARKMGGENFYRSTFTAGPQGGWIDLVPETPGDIVTIPLTGQNQMLVSSGSWLASSYGVETATEGSGRSFLAGEGLFVLRATGVGDLLINAYGAMDHLQLAPGQLVTVDTGHLVAWDAAIQMQTRKIAGWRNSIKSGEGFVVDFVGPGLLITQTRVPTAIQSATSSNSNSGLSSVLNVFGDS
jgi:uncharacterized protein (TIGR00266 family)